ncbi:CoA transferase, partial [Chloroflexota bacterium]
MATSTQEMHDRLEKPMSRFFLAHTKAELYKEARKRDVQLTPVNTPGDVLEDIQLRSRAFWTELEHPELAATITYPGSFAKMSITPCGVSRRAPLIGEHNREIYEKESGLSNKQIDAFKPKLPRIDSSCSKIERSMPTQALEGVKVVDFSWVLVGPLMVKYLADHGATVIHIESSTRIDNARSSAPRKPGTPNANTSGMFAYINSNKYSISLNLKNPEGLRIARKLIAWGDVVVDNFSPGSMAKWGLAYEDIIKIKSDIIMMQCSMLGQTGPRAKDRGYGIGLTGLAGLTHLTGWPDRGPMPPFGAYTDFIACIFGATALISALDFRRRTGKGQYIDLSQYEAAEHFSAAAVLDYVINGREGTRMGNRCDYAAPHAAYRCHGDDRWCAIATFTDDEWEAFCQVIGNPEWTRNPRFSTLIARKENEAELDRLVEEWTVNHSAEEIMDLMQSKGVPAGVVQTGEDLLNDPQLKHRDYFWWLNHSELGPFPHLGQPFKLSKAPAQARMPSPCLGEHTEMVCREILGMSDEEFLGLLNAGAFE